MANNSNDFDILFLGGLFPKETEKEIFDNSIGSVQSAANTLQWNLVNGLEKCTSKPIKIYNSLYIGAYPFRYKKLLIKSYPFKHSINSKDINIGYINVIGLKHFFRFITLKPYLKKWAQSPTENKVLIAYALTDTFVRSIKYIKKINPRICTCIIVPDLPEYMNTSKDRSLIYTILKGIEIKSIKSKMSYIDSYVLLTEHMKNFMKINKSNVIIEGISTDLFEEISVDNKNLSEKTILYTGTLNEKYGILNLIEAFKNIPYDNYKLLICGTGDCVDKIKAEANSDKRIIYKGVIRREEVLKLQKMATVLINPRQNNEEYTKYSFPSKILEYLSSGTPVIAYKLDGIPDEYDNFMYYVENNSITALKEKIVEVCEKDQHELSYFGEKARNFVIKEKNNEVQARKIIDMLSNIIQETK